MRILKNYEPKHKVIDLGNNDLYIIYTTNAIKDKTGLYFVWARRYLKSQSTMYCIKKDGETPEPHEFEWTDKLIDRMWHEYCMNNKQKVLFSEAK